MEFLMVISVLMYEKTAFVDSFKYSKHVLRINPESPVLKLMKNRIFDFIKNHGKLS